MNRMMDFKALFRQLQSSRNLILQCRSNATRFALDAEQHSDALWQISLHIADLEGLERDILRKHPERLELAARDRHKAPYKTIPDLAELQDPTSFGRLGASQEPSTITPFRIR